MTGWYVFDKKEISAVLFVITEWELIDALLWISPQNNKKWSAFFKIFISYFFFPNVLVRYQ